MKNNKERQLNKDYLDFSSQMYEWFMSDEGQSLRCIESALIEQVLSRVNGEHFCSVGFSEHIHQFSSTLMPYTFSLGSLQLNQSPVHSDVHFWPVLSRSMDVVLLHHVLDWTRSPQRVLREATRALCPSGTLVVIGFNPLSVYSLSRFFSAKHPNVCRKATWYSANVVIEWLDTLGFSCESVSFFLRRAPFKYSVSNPVIPASQGMLCSIPIGGIYMLVALKEGAGYIFSNDAWQRERFYSVGASYARSQAEFNV